MSAKGRGPATGGKHGQNFTPAWCVDRLLEVWSPPIGGVWLEPGAGDGSIIRAMSRKWVTWWMAVEIDPQFDDRLGLYAQQVEIRDFLTMPALPEDTTLAIGNPNYEIAMETIMTIQRLAPAAEIMLLLRLNFLASDKRRDWFAKNEPHVFVLPNRPSFTDDGRTDATEYCWMWWGGRALPGITHLAMTPDSVRNDTTKGR